MSVFRKSESLGLDIENIDDEGDEGIGDWNSVKFLYCNSTWNHEHFTYELKPMEFMEVSVPKVIWYQFFTFLQLFKLFWPYNLCCRIVYETN